MQEFQTMVVFKEKAKSWNLQTEPLQKIVYSIFGNYSKAQCGSNVWEKFFYMDSLHVKRLIIENNKWPGLVYKET